MLILKQRPPPQPPQVRLHEVATAARQPTTHTSESFKQLNLALTRTASGRFHVNITVRYKSGNIKQNTTTPCSMLFLL